MNITNVRITKLENSNVLALATITIDNDFVVSNLRVIDGQKGVFVAMPSLKDRKGEYHDIAYPITKQAREQLIDAVLAKYSEQNEPYVPVPDKEVRQNNGRKPIDVPEDDLPF